MTTLPNESHASASKGIWFVFHHGGHTIRATGSYWTGLERVYFNHDLILQFVRRGDKLEFEVGGTQYRIEFCTRSVSIGKMLCTFYINGNLTYSLRSTRLKILNTRPVTTHIVACATFGLLSGLLHLPLWAGLACIMLSFAITLLTTAKKDKFVIEQHLPEELLQQPA